ncbi:MAG: PIN domain-containing protein [Deltaproteobacteria bacterium]|nr:PIN domain-containing protein [Deltaproteobacteria bacterium]
MRLFLDTSVLLAAAGSANGSSRALFSYAATQGWVLICSPYALNEVLRNLPKLPASATTEWLRLRLRPQVTMVDDVVSLDRPVVFAASKDRPILFTALAWAEVLLTLDKADFADVLSGTFYGLRVLLPYNFLQHERTVGRL